MPETTWPFWLNFIILAVVLVSLCRLSRGFYLVSLPVALLAVYNGLSFLITNVSFRNALIQEMGFGYFVQFTCCYALPIFSLAAYAYYDFRFRRSSQRQ